MLRYYPVVLFTLRSALVICVVVLDRTVEACRLVCVFRAAFAALHVWSTEKKRGRER